MIDDYLNDTSLKTINALYHKYRVELLIDKSVEGEAEVEAEHGILGLDIEQAKAKCFFTSDFQKHTIGKITF
jgi:hypothetical protein